ncbi:hypothetical protein GCM10007320_22580 [Pseudorhodoferax aquiterrae]|uniref:Uncharacterized protein n=1 Tax=Pseudorhodoferax aquiterrae TaxID=747304 RepID=A0ABQ3G198_9BURK|nr:hypothetical protein GCM10007320_22580 [Pseudorhodoferax aquiterrae]
MVFIRRQSPDAGTTFAYEAANKARLNFNAAGKVSLPIPRGVHISIAFTGSDPPRSR